MMCKTDICFCIVKKNGKVFRIKTQTGQSAMFFCVLGKRERFLVEETQSVLYIKNNMGEQYFDENVWLFKGKAVTLRRLYELKASIQY